MALNKDNVALQPFIGQPKTIESKILHSRFFDKLFRAGRVTNDIVNKAGHINVNAFIGSKTVSVNEFEFPPANNYISSSDARFGPQHSGKISSRQYSINETASLNIAFDQIDINNNSNYSATKWFAQWIKMRMNPLFDRAVFGEIEASAGVNAITGVTSANAIAKINRAMTQISDNFENSNWDDFILYATPTAMELLYSTAKIDANNSRFQGKVSEGGVIDRILGLPIKMTPQNRVGATTRFLLCYKKGLILVKRPTVLRMYKNNRNHYQGVAGDVINFMVNYEPIITKNVRYGFCKITS